MRFPARSRSACACLRVERLEDRTAPSATPAPDPVRVNVVTTATAESPADEALFAAAVDYLGFGIYRVTLAAGATADAAVSYYSHRPGVLVASPDTQVGDTRIPNDPSYPALYAMPAVSAPAAWDVTTGASNFVV